MKDFANSLIDTIHEPFLLMSEDKIIMYANKSFYDDFKVTHEETIGKRVYEIGNGQWDIPKFHTLLDKILQDKEEFKGLEVETDFPTIGHKIMVLNARMVQLEPRTIEFIFLAIKDITDVRNKENELKEYEARYRRQFDTAHDGLLLLEYNTGRIVNSNPAISSILGYSLEDFKGKTLQDIGINDDMEFQNVLSNLKDFGFVYYDYIVAKTKEGKTIDIELYLVDRTKLIQCNVRDITERKKKETELRIYYENLVETVKKNTAKLKEKIRDLEPMMVENKMAELKETIKELEAEVLSLKKPGIPPG